MMPSRYLTLKHNKHCSSVAVFAITFCLIGNVFAVSFCRAPVSGEPVIPLATRNFSLLESDARGYYKQVENIDISRSQVSLPMYSGTPFKGILKGNGFNITHFVKQATASEKAALFGIVDGSCIDVVVDSPIVQAGDSGIITIEARNNNTISASISNAHLLGNTTSGLIAGQVNGKSNKFILYNTTGSVSLVCNYNHGCKPINVLAAGLGVGVGLEDTQLELTQVNVQGEVSLVAENDSRDGSYAADMCAALGVGTSSGDVKLEQLNVQGNVRSYGNALPHSPTFARTQNSAGLGIACGTGDVKQQNVRGNVKAYSGDDVDNVIHYAALGIGSTGSGEDTLSLTQTNVFGNVNATTISGSTFAALGVANIDYDPELTECRVIQKGVKGNVYSTCPSIHGVKGAFGALGVAHNGREFLILSQIAVQGIVRGPVRQDQVYLAASIGEIASWGDDSDIAGATFNLFSGGYAELPAYASGGDITGLVDISGYQSQPSQGIRRLNSTYPQDWRVCQKALCDIYDCQANSCHYIHESFQGLTAQDNNILLITRQHYPFGDNLSEKNGVFRVTRLHGDEIPLQVDTANFGKNGYLLYPAPTSDELIPTDSFPELMIADEKRVLALYTPEAGTMQLASFPVDDRDDSHYYQLSSYELEGQPVLLSNNDYGSVWMRGNDSELYRYDMDANGHLNVTAVEYDLTHSTFPDDEVIAFGSDKTWLYTARRVNDQHKVALERLNIENRQFDPGWTIYLDEKVEDNADYQLILKGELIALLPEGIAPLEPREFGSVTAVNVSLPEYGGCADWSESNFAANYTVPAVPMIPLKNATILIPTSHPNSSSLSDLDIIGISVASGVVGIGALLLVGTTMGCLVYHKAHRRTYEPIQ